jgi:hypothetical protein
MVLKPTGIISSVLQMPMIPFVTASSTMAPVREGTSLFHEAEIGQLGGGRVAWRYFIAALSRDCR